MPHRLFSTKPIGELHEADESGNELSRTLDARALVLLGIGAIIGTGGDPNGFAGAMSEQRHRPAGHQQVMHRARGAA